MRRLSTTAAMLVAGILAILLIAYVFSGSNRVRSDRAPHCVSAQGLDQIRAELFRRAGQVRGATDPAFANVARYSVVLAPSRMVRRHHEGSGKVTCSGTLALELPPGVAVAGGRRSVAAPVSYDLEPTPAGAARLLQLSKADGIVVPLATLFQTASETGRTPATSSPATNRARAEAQKTVSPKAEPPSGKPVAPAVPPPARKESSKRPAPSTSRVSAAPPTPPAAPKATSSAPAPPPPRIAAVKPSFNCRYARTRGEIAVCSNGELASLDRQMSAQFFSALSAARPGQRAMLQRSRNRFLRYRDSCQSERCIANAYAERMREIGDIMAAGW